MSVYTRAMWVVVVGAALLGLVAADAQAASVRRPDVVIIKLKSAAAKTVGTSKGIMATGVRSLDRLNVGFDVRDFRRTVPAALSRSGSSDPYGLTRYYTVDLPTGSNLDVALAAYGADPNVESVEPDYIAPMYMTPNDPDYNQQWTHTYDDTGIDTPVGWDYEVGDSTVVVGVIDSGVLHNHPDLKPGIWVNPGEDLNHNGLVWDAADVNGLDDDGNGLIDDLIGWDFMGVQSGCYAGEDCNGPDNDPADFAGHGTHVAGIAAATTGNGVGVAGIAGGNRAARRPGVKIMALRAGYLASDRLGYVVMSACAQAFAYAVNKGVCAVNCSWGTSGSLIRDAVLDAENHGIVVCKAAGNDATNVPDIVDSTYGVIAVAALKRDGVMASFSNYGPWVDISAPGDDIHNTYGGLGVAGYADLSGTSMASPTVMGVAALLKSHHPWFTKTQIDTLLTKYVDDVYTLNPSMLGQLGSGKVNARRVLEILTTADFSVDVTLGKVPLTVNFTNTSPNAPSGPYEYTFGDGGTAGTADASHAYTSPGVYGVTFTGSGPSGPHTRIRPALIAATQDTIEYGDVSLDVGQNGSFPIRIHNTHPMKQFTIPVRFTQPPVIVIDSIVWTSLVSGWTIKTHLNDPYHGRMVWVVSTGTGGTVLPVGGGVVANLWVHPYSGSTGQVSIADTLSMGSPPRGLQLLSEWADFTPDFVAGSVTIPIPPCSCPCHGDPICDGVPTVNDVVTVVNVAFRSGIDTIDPTCTHIGRSDVNCDCQVNVQDVVIMVNHAFRGDTNPFCDPCAHPCP